MEILNFNSTETDEVIKILKRGGVVVAPTDTVYGLLSDASNPIALKTLLSIKERPPGKPVSVFVSDFRMMKDFVYIDKKQEETLSQILPGPFTVVLPSKHKLPLVLEGEGGTLGMRIPDYSFITNLVRSFGRPLTATSANLSGDSPYYSSEAVLNGFTKKKLESIDLVIDAGKLPLNRPSTVVDLTTDSMKTIREGDIVFSNSETYRSGSPEQTQKIAAYLIQKIFSKTEKPMVFILKGELGAGKTVFAKGIGQVLGIADIISPTYVIYYEYDSAHPRIKHLYHFDLFNIQEKRELTDLNIDKFIHKNTILCIEWGEKAVEILPMLKKQANVIYIEMAYLSEAKREIKVKYDHPIH